MESQAPPASPLPWPDRPRQYVSVLVEDRPDLLPHSVGLLQRRAFRVTSVTVGPTDSSHVARLTIALEGPPSEAERLVRELSRLLYVLAAQDLSKEPAVVRELALLKVRCGAAERSHISQLCDAFRARMVDVCTETVTVEVTGHADKIEGFLAVLRPFGLAEVARTGPVALARSGKSLAAEGKPSSWLERQRAKDAASAS